jgi:hypothetical protein
MAKNDALAEFMATVQLPSYLTASAARAKLAAAATPAEELKAGRAAAATANPTQAWLIQQQQSPTSAATPATPVAKDPKAELFMPIAMAQQKYLQAVIAGAAGNPAAMSLVYKAQQDIAQQTAEWNREYDAALRRNQQAAEQQNYYNQQASNYQQQMAVYQQQAKAMEEANLQAQQNFIAAQQESSNQFQTALKESQRQQAELLQQQQEAIAAAAEKQRLFNEQQRAIADSVVPLPQQATAGFDYSGSRQRRKRASGQSLSTSAGISSSSGLRIPR